MSLGPDDLLFNTYCVREVSKNVDGQVMVLDADQRVCTTPACEPLTLVLYLRLNLVQNECDSDLGALLDGGMRIKDLTAVYAGPRETVRGVHAAHFYWRPAVGGRIVGTLEGISNAGIARPPVFPHCERCERCEQPGVLIGHLFGTGNNVPGIPVPDFNLEGVYRFAWDPIAGIQNTAPVIGTVEGVVIMPCT